MTSFATELASVTDERTYVRTYVRTDTLPRLIYEDISGTAERICAKFTGKTCLVFRSDKFEGQGQKSRSSGTKTAFFGAFGGLRKTSSSASFTTRLLDA